MMRLLKYELKRLMLNKFYLGLVIIICLFAWQMLTGDVIRGIGYTAPFSGWSFGFYLASIVPLLSVSLLFFLTYLHRPAEARATQILRATPMDPRKHLALRYAAMGIGYGVLVLLVLLLGHVFYRQFFQMGLTGAHILPALLTLLPCFLFMLGIGALAGRIHVGMLYALMLGCILLMQFSLPSLLDFSGGAYYGGMPMTLPVAADGEPIFMVTGGFAASRVLLALVGVVGVWVSLRLVRGRSGSIAKR